MRLEELSNEEIKDIMKKLILKVEANEEVVEKGLMHRKVYKYNRKYCINFYNGFDYMICSIDNINADISSESLNDNLELTKYYHQLLQEAFEKKVQAITL